MNPSFHSAQTITIETHFSPIDDANCYAVVRRHGMTICETRIHTGKDDL